MTFWCVSRAVSFLRWWSTKISNFAALFSVLRLGIIIVPFKLLQFLFLYLFFFSHQFWKEFLRDLEKNEMNDGGFDGFNANTFGETSNGDTTIPQYTHSKKRSCRIVSQLRI